MQTITDNAGKVYLLKNGTAYHKDTKPEVMAWLETSRERKQVIRVFYGNPETGEAWPDEVDVLGHVGRSTGQIKIPLMISHPRASGGPGMLESCIVAIATSGKSGPAFVYKHPRLNLGQWTTRQCTDESLRAKGYVAEALRNGEVHARFKRTDKAESYCLFMLGKRMKL